MLLLFSHVQLFVTPWTEAHQDSLSFSISWVCSNSCSLSWWCYPTISSSVAPFSSILPSFPALWSFPLSQLFTSGGQSIGVSASVLVLPRVFKYSIHTYWAIFMLNADLSPRDRREISRWSLPASQSPRYPQAAHIFRVFTTNWARISQFCTIKILVQTLLCSEWG